MGNYVREDSKHNKLRKQISQTWKTCEKACPSISKGDD